MDILYRKDAGSAKCDSNAIEKVMGISAMGFRNKSAQRYTAIHWVDFLIPNLEAALDQSPHPGVSSRDLVRNPPNLLTCATGGIGVYCPCSDNQTIMRRAK